MLWCIMRTLLTKRRLYSWQDDITGRGMSNNKYMGIVIIVVVINDYVAKNLAFGLPTFTRLASRSCYFLYIYPLKMTFTQLSYLCGSIPEEILNSNIKRYL